MQEINNCYKIGVISDTHIPIRAAVLPSKIYEHFSNVDLIIHCGDLVSLDVVSELQSLAPLVIVKGNMDSFIPAYPDFEILKINSKYTLCIAHGTGSYFDIKQRLHKNFVKYKPTLVLYGHTHIASDDIYQDMRFFNPGSATAGSSFNSIGLLNISENGIKTEVITI